MESKKKEIEQVKKKWSSAAQQDPIDVANSALDDVPFLLSALEASQREAAWLREAYSKLMDNALGCENCYEDAQALARTKKKGG